MNKRYKLLSLLLCAGIVASALPSSGTGATSESIAFYNSKKSILEMKEYDELYDTNHDGVVNVFDVIRENKEVFQEESYTDLKSQIHSLETQIEILTQKLTEKEDKSQSESDLSEINSKLSGKVDFQEGKQLSSNDYTDLDKEKLEGLKNYDDSKINEKIDSLVLTAYEEKKGIESSIENKVDKEEGKQLSSNDFSDEDKSKLGSLENYNDSNIKSEISDINTKLSSINDAVSGKVDFQEGKQLSSNDYTDEEKQKLECLNNYDDTELKSEINDVKSDLVELGAEYFNIIRPSKFELNAFLSNTIGESTINSRSAPYGNNNIHGVYEVNNNEKIYHSDVGESGIWLYLYDTNGILRSFGYLERIHGSYFTCHVDGYTIGYFGIMSQLGQGEFIAYKNINDSEKANLDLYKLPKLLIEDENEGFSFNNFSNFSAFSKFGVIGDSLSVGYQTNSSGGITANINQSWGHRIEQVCSNKMVNFGEAGETTKRWLSDEYGKYSEFIDPNNQCQCYILCLGYNDRWSQDVFPKGSISDIDKFDYNNNADTFYGNYAKIIQIIKEKYPLAKVFCLSMPTEKPAIDTTGYNNAIKEVCEYGVGNAYFIDMYELYHNWYLTLDGDFDGHYHTQTYFAMGEKIATAISNYMMDNLSEFSFVSEIPYAAD